MIEWKTCWQLQSIVATQIHKQDIKDFNFKQSVFYWGILLYPCFCTTTFNYCCHDNITVDCTFKVWEIKAMFLNYVAGCLAKVIRWTRVKAKWKSQFRQWWWWDSRRFVIAKYFGKFKYMWASDQLIKRSSNLNLISTYSMVLCQLKTFINSNFITMISLFMYKK